MQVASGKKPPTTEAPTTNGAATNGKAKKQPVDDDGEGSELSQTSDIEPLDDDDDDEAMKMASDEEEKQKE